MHSLLAWAPLLALVDIGGIWHTVWPYLVIFAGFSGVIFVHELGHFLAAKWADVKVERFAIGFFNELVGFTRGETRYSFNVLPLGGYVKMLGQEDFDDKGNELVVKDDPRAFSNKPIYKRMVIVSAGVVMNVLLAAVLFVVAFMDGMEGRVTTIGYVMRDSPAAMAGLQPGDTIKQINDMRIREYQEIMFAIMLADPHSTLDFKIERSGEIQHVAVKPEPFDQENLLKVGIAPATTDEVGFLMDTRFDPNNPKHLRMFDRIVAIEGEPVDPEAKGRLEERLRSADGSPVRVTVERPVTDDPDGPREIREAIVFNEMLVDPADPFSRDEETRSILGLVPLVRVLSVNERGRAALAGLKPEDVILKWGPHEYPSEKQILDSIRSATNEPAFDPDASLRSQLYDALTWEWEVDIPVTVLRRGEDRPVSVVVRPEVRRKGHPYVGFRISAVAIDTLRVSTVLEDVYGRPTPAFQAGISKGDLIEAVDGEPVANWPELVEQLRRAAGRSVPVTYRTQEGETVTAPFDVPHTIRTTLGLTTLASIESIDGQRVVNVDTPTRRRKVSVSYSYGQYEVCRRLLEAAGGPTTVTVAYRERPFEEIKTAEVTLTTDMVDPWFGRIRYRPNMSMNLATQVIKADGVVDALGMGVKKTWYFIYQVYTMMQRMIVERSVGVENVAGPVGIVKTGSDVARMGVTRLLFFLAIISANLAVINFLPLPIVDGGLMVFLIVEKIKGSPVSLKVQVATQVIGLVLIGTVFVLVTFQDVIRLAG